MAKSKKQQNDEIPKPTEEIRVDKPKFKDTLASMIKKKPPESQNKSKD